MNPLDTPHHLRATQWCEYREGAVINRPAKKGKGSWANIGLLKDCQLDLALQEGTRVTIRLNESKFDDNLKYYSGTVVSTEEPYSETGMYWGYKVRVASTLEQAFKESTYAEPYDLKMGTSDVGEVAEFADYSPWEGFKHAFVFFGGLEGIEGLIEQEEQSSRKKDETEGLFDLYLNTCPEQGTRTIRTEEAILVSLAQICPNLRQVGRRVR